MLAFVDTPNREAWVAEIGVKQRTRVEKLLFDLIGLIDELSEAVWLSPQRREIGDLAVESCPLHPDGWQASFEGRRERSALICPMCALLVCRNGNTTKERKR